jgi:hypothetical protein
LKVDLRFGVTFFFHLQGRRISQLLCSTELVLFAFCFHAGLLFGLFFNPEDEGNIFAILTEIARVFPQFFQENPERIPLLRHDRLLPYPFQFINHPPIRRYVVQTLTASYK